ncbi:MFS transporter [Chloroflexota bacterium]
MTEGRDSGDNQPRKVNVMSNGVSQRVVLVVTVVAVFLLPFMGSSVNVALPTIGQEFGMEAGLMGWVHTAYLVASAAFLVPVCRLADIYGRRRFFLYGSSLFIIASFITAISNSAALLIACRALGGIGGATMTGTAIAILSSVYPPEKRGWALGINTGSIYLGLSLGPFLGGVMTEHLGWRSLFYFAVILGLVIVALAIWKLRGEWADARGEKFDVAGSIIFSVSLIVAMYGFTLLPAVPGIILLILGLLGMLAFVRWESKAESPLFNTSLFRRNRVFVFSNLAALINYSAIYAMLFLLSLYLQYIKGFSPSAAGLILLAAPVVQTIVSPVAGRLADRFESAIVASVGIAASCVSLLLFTFLTGETGLGYIVGSLVIFGLGTALFSSPNTNAVMGSVEKRFLGVASGTAITMRTGGMALSMGISMILFTVFIGQAEITPEYYPAFLTSLKVGFIVFVALCFCGLLAQLAGRKKGR